jgi:hypothetical protein
LSFLSRSSALLELRELEVEGIRDSGVSGSVGEPSRGLKAPSDTLAAFTALAPLVQALSRPLQAKYKKMHPQALSAFTASTSTFMAYINTCTASTLQALSRPILLFFMDSESALNTAFLDKQPQSKRKKILSCKIIFTIIFCSYFCVNIFSLFILDLAPDLK